MSRSKRLSVVLALNMVLVAALVIVGVSSHSLGVFAEGVDYLADAAGIAVALFAIRLSRRPPTPTRPHGYPKATGIAALVNGGWLLALNLLIVAGAIRRLTTSTPEVHGLAILIVSAIAALTMLAGALILRGDADHPDGADGADGADGDLNLRAVLLDTAADAAAATGVAITGGIILITGGLYWLDPAVALIVSVVVAYHALRLLRRVITVLGAAHANT